MSTENAWWRKSWGKARSEAQHVERGQAHALAAAHNTAEFSPCGLYRHRLDRAELAAGEGLYFAFFGINPSTAGAVSDDQTIRKLRVFTVRNGGGRFCITNPFDLIATDVRQLAQHSAPVSLDNHLYLRGAISDADVLVPCWGDLGKIPRELRPTVDELLADLRASGKPVKCFGTTKGGHPRHPLMLGYNTQLVDYAS